MTHQSFQFLNVSKFHQPQTGTVDLYSMCVWRSTAFAYTKNKGRTKPIYKTKIFFPSIRLKNEI